MEAALFAMISTLFVAMLGNSWHQSRENSKTRELMVQLNNDTRSEFRSELKVLATELRADHRVLGDELRADHRVLGDELRADMKALGVGLGDVRERLSRIEGCLGIGITRPLGPATEDSESRDV